MIKFLGDLNGVQSLIDGGVQLNADNFDPLHHAVKPSSSGKLILNQFVCDVSYNLNQITIWLIGLISRSLCF